MKTKKIYLSRLLKLARYLGKQHMLDVLSGKVKDYNPMEKSSTFLGR
jgi:hypothetical protein